jgi:hypothetical protein
VLLGGNRSKKDMSSFPIEFDVSRSGLYENSVLRRSQVISLVGVGDLA